MASPSSQAIGGVSELLSTRLSAAVNNVPVTVSRPDVAAAAQGRKLNLFLYRLSIDPHLRNEPLDVGQMPPIWLVLHYLLTAFDDGNESDSTDAHRLLGQGMAALQQLNFIRPPATAVALTKNPDALKLTFDDADVELLSRVMQGTDEKYRLSAAIQVRPVMLAIESAPDYAPLVKTIGPPANQGVVVLPNMGARLSAIDPVRFVAGTPVKLDGKDLAGYDEVLLGADSFPLVPDAEGNPTFTVPAASPVAASAYPLCIARTLPSGRKITSNAVLAELMPRVTDPAINGNVTVLPPGGPAALRHGNFVVNGTQLGGANASVFATLFGDGAAHGLLEPDAGATNTRMRFTIPPAGALPPGPYRVVVRVNGQQAADSPELTW